MRFEPFSTPDDAALRRRLVRDTLGAESRNFARGLVRRWRDPLRAHSSGVVELLSDWACAPPTLRQCLGFPLQHFRQWLREARDPLWPAVAAAAHLCSHGFVAEWTATLHEPRRVHWGRFVTPPALRFAVEADASACVLRVWDAGGRSTTGPLEGTAPTGWTADHAVRTEHGHLHVVESGAQDLRPFSSPFEPCTVSNVEVASSIRDALSVMTHYAPAYRSWVEDAIRCVVPIPLLPGGLSQSQSVQGLPAVVRIACPLDPVAIAESLVHEASHQYAHYAESVGPTSNGRDPRRYYSPYPRQDRPIERILLAYHAFANVCLFYRCCADAGAPFADTCERNRRMHEPLLSQLDSVLAASPGLTDMGHALWHPASARLLGRQPSAEAPAPAPCTGEGVDLDSGPVLFGARPGSTGVSC